MDTKSAAPDRLWNELLAYGGTRMKLLQKNDLVQGDEVLTKG